MDITQYIGIDLDELIEERRSLHEERSKLAAICNDKLMAKNLDSLEDSLTIEYMQANPSLAFNKAQAMAMSDPRYKERLNHYATVLERFTFVDQEYWLLKEQFDKGMKLIDFAKQETFIMNRSK